jgi:ankyrin repeat protein
MPPLNLAILKRDETIIKYLLKKKANPLIKDELGRNALDVAQQKNMANIQDLLAKYIK